MNWTKKDLATACKVLRGFTAPDSRAMEAIGGALERDVTYDAIATAFRRHKLKPMRNFCHGGHTHSDPGFVIPQGIIPTHKEAEQAVEAYSGKLPRRVICDSDNHYPIACKHVEAAKLKFAQDVKPDLWLNCGDLFDFWGISRHDKEAAKWFGGKARQQEEFDSARPYTKEVCRVSDEVILIPGNHERRLYSLINANPSFFGLKAFEWHTLAGLPEKYKVLKYGARLRVGAMTFEHGDQIGGRFGVASPPTWLLTNKGNKNTIFGHFHRSESKHKTVFDEDGNQHDYIAIAQGHGSIVNEQTYIREPSWQHSFTYIEMWQDKGKPRFTAHQIVITNGQFMFGGKLYDGRRA